MGNKKCFICNENDVWVGGKICWNCDEDSYNIGVNKVINDLRKIVSQNKSEKKCYKDILTYIWKEKEDVEK